MDKPIKFNRWQVTAVNAKTNQEQTFDVSGAAESDPLAVERQFLSTHGKLFRVTRVLPLSDDGTPVTPATLAADAALPTAER